MIVRHFLQWVRTAEAAERAEATRALARAYLYSDLIARRSHRRRRRDDHAARRSLAAGAPRARRGARRERGCAGRRRCMRWSTISRTSRRSCSSARRCCSTPIWSIRSRSAAPRMQAAIARRAHAAALGRGRASPKSARAEACLTLIENPGADIAPFSLDRIVAALRPSRGDPRGAARLARTCRPRSARRWWSSCPRRSRASWSRATGWRRAGRSASRRKPARRRP